MYHVPRRNEIDHVFIPEVVSESPGIVDFLRLNVNTELRQAYVGALKKALGPPEQADLLELMRSAVADMQGVVSAKLRLFDSAGKGDEVALFLPAHPP